MACEGCVKAKEPSFIQMARTAAKALGTGALAIVSGREVFSQEELIQVRIKKCLGCEFINRKPMKCSVCNCYLKLKVKLFEEKCPSGISTYP